MNKACREVLSWFRDVAVLLAVFSCFAYGLAELLR